MSSADSLASSGMLLDYPLSDGLSVTSNRDRSCVLVYNDTTDKQSTMLTSGKIALSVWEVSK